jgi:hypothetical protein
MAKPQGRATVLNFLAWFTGVVVSLVVGNAMIQRILTLPAWLGGATDVGAWIAVAIGWIVVITTLVGAVLALLRK